MINSNNMDHVENNNLTELESFNRGVQDFLLSLSANDHQEFSDHHQIPFSMSNNIIIDAAPSSDPNYNTMISCSQLHLQEPILSNFDSLSCYFPQGGGGASSSHGFANFNIPSSIESDDLANSSSEFLQANKANSGSYDYGGKKRKRSNNVKEAKKPKEVVHVRAKRGQATDSHSIAERLRREKINEKLRCLQDLVPGCYKTMGMAVMLDVIINYVRSLQNQIDFLSMKLSAASEYYDFNNADDMNAMGAMQGMHGFEEQGMGEAGYGGVLPDPLPPQSHTANWPL